MGESLENEIRAGGRLGKWEETEKFSYVRICFILITAKKSTRLDLPKQGETSDPAVGFS